MIATVADGASVNERGRVPGWVFEGLPLTAALFNTGSGRAGQVVVWLLAHGADPNGAEVMWHVANEGVADILQLLIDAGGDVNRESIGEVPLRAAVHIFHRSEDNVRVLLAQPSLDFTLKSHDGRTPEQYARDTGELVHADMMATEVSEKGVPCVVGARKTHYSHRVSALLWLGRGRVERRWYDHWFARLIAHVVMCSGYDWMCCRLYRSRQSVCVARWRLQTRRAWHGWCVACFGCHHPQNAQLSCFYWVMCICCCGDGGRGQAEVGLRQLRTPAVRNFILSAGFSWC